MCDSEGSRVVSGQVYGYGEGVVSPERVCDSGKSVCVQGECVSGEGVGLRGGVCDFGEGV